MGHGWKYDRSTIHDIECVLKWCWFEPTALEISTATSHGSL